MLRAVVLLCVVMALAVGCEEGNVFELAEGDCFNYQGEQDKEVSDVELVPCEDPHQFEAYAVVLIEEPSGLPFPGSTQVGLLSDNLCLASFEEFVGLPYSDSILEVLTFSPSQDSWEDMDDREVVCVLFDPEDLYTEGSMRGSGR